MRYIRNGELLFIVVLVALVSTAFKIEHFIFFSSVYVAVFAASLFILFSTVFKAKNKQNGVVSVPINRIDLAVFLFFVYFIIRFATSPGYNVGFAKFVLWLLCFLMYIIVKFSNTAQAQTGNVIHVVVFFGLAQSVFALLQRMNLALNIMDFPMGGSFGNPGDLANYLVLSYACALGYLLGGKNKPFNYVYIGAIILLLTTIILSNARTAWVAVGIVTCCLLFDYSAKIRYRKAVLAGLAVVGIPLLVVAAKFLYTYKSGSSEGRLFIWKQCMAMIADKPLFGYGYDSFVSSYSTQQCGYFLNHPGDIANSLLADDIVFAYNDYLQMAIEYGLIGFGLLALIFYFLFQHIRKGEKATGKMFMAPFVALWVAMLFSYPLQNPSIILTVFVLIATLSKSNPEGFITLPVNGVMRNIVLPARLGLSVIGLLLSGIFLYGGQVWKQGYSKYLKSDLSYEADFREVYKILRHDKSFFYHYGTILNATGNYRLSSTIIEEGLFYCRNSKILMVLAENYEKMGDINTAASYYRQASCTKPCLFTPRYKLFLLYRKNDFPEKALQVAREIKDMNIKVYSDKVNEIQSEVNRYLVCHSDDV